MEYPKSYRVKSYQVFVAEGLGTLRAEMIDGRAWFYAVDICKILNLPKICRLVSTGKITASEYMLATRLTKNGRRKVYLVTIPGVKELINTNSTCKNEDKLKTFLEWFCGKVTLELCGHNIDISGDVIRMVDGFSEKEYEKVNYERIEKEARVRKIKVFINPEFGTIRTEIINGEPWFCLSDVCKALELTNPSIVKQRLNAKGLSTAYTLTAGGKQELLFINEANLYKTIFQSRKESAERFTDWVAGEVLPSIRKTGSYQQTPPLTTAGQIQLIAKGYVELEQQVATLGAEVTELKTDMPLYGCEIDEVQQHVKRKGVQCLGGKDSEAYADGSIRSQVYKDIYSQLKREYGCVSTYKSIKRKYIADVHDFIDCYQLPTVLEEQITAANAQQRLF